ncbi:uncharacterized protein AMSG_03411 [Thecamonas trahens ATCC 50062]|uniref:Uncharacterized protein n=1 Tax=Thecamonas trahens ATCC 50062 TaxID=461836 RepID=A0A0L0D6P7_THETB|nr:hypothetical protein AMSG_03411 [Thecamonas trahens ATCC 50062]KNC46978.1 hypothetical protein AMSG_03411 [Thecamonas trahens ATCC 50062]|eukprot:XP_013760249.1 hypothetical protein AMSG_03411 [Thecamonas trahens ATCC 50062]
MDLLLGSSVQIEVAINSEAGNKGKSWPVLMVGDSFDGSLNAACLGVLTSSGWPDIIAVKDGTGIEYYRNNEGSFGDSSVIISASLQPTWIGALQISVPYPGAPSQDLVLLGHETGGLKALAWMRNTYGNGTGFGAPLVALAAQALSPPIFADMDGDGLDDIVIHGVETANNLHTVWIIRNTGSGELKPPTMAHQVQEGVTITAVTAGKFSQAGKLTLPGLILATSVNIVRLEQISPLQFAIRETISDLDSHHEVVAMATIDEGTLEIDSIAFATANLSTVAWAQRRGSGGSWVVDVLPGELNGIVQLQTGRIFNQGSRDIVAVTATRVVGYEAIAVPSPPPPPASPPPPPPAPTSPTTPPPPPPSHGAGALVWIILTACLVIIIAVTALIIVRRNRRAAYLHESAPLIDPHAGYDDSYYAINAASRA